MKPALAMIGGFIISLGIFASGAAMALYFLMAQPVDNGAPRQDVASAWSSDVRRIDPSSQPFERIGARETASPQPATAPVQDGSENGVDLALTASIAAAPSGRSDGADEQTASELTAAHLEWCANRYRSYRPRDNSYTPFSGGRRPCVSPYSEDAARIELSPPPVDQDAYVEPSEEALGDTPAGWMDAEAETVAMSDDHVSYCYSRYRSYDPSDNSYQPYGGGPRQQCR